MSNDEHRTPSDAVDQPQEPRGLSRRSLLAAGFFGVLGSQLLLHGTGASSATAADAVTLPGDGFTLSASGGTVSLADATGAVRQRFRGYRLGALNLTTGSSALGTAADGTAAIVVNWDVNVAGASVKGTFIPRGRRLEIVYDIVLPGATSAGTGMMRREAVPGPAVETFSGVADWVRDPRGGIPFQTNGRSVYEQEFGDISLFIVAPGSNSAWRDSGAVNLPATQSSSGVFRAVANVAFAVDSRPVIVEALVTGRALAADVWTDRPFNIWDDASAPLMVHGAALNGRAARPVTFSWVARDFDGVILAQKDVTVAADAQGAATVDLAVPLTARGMAFVELTATAGGDTSYARTNIAVLPPHEFVETSETSMFGLAADYLFGPPEERALIKRIGVRHERHNHFTAAELDQYGFTQHRLRTPASLEEFDGDPAALTAYVKAEIDLALTGSAIAYECANEWNMKGGILNGVGAEKYVTKWARAFRAEIDARGLDLKLLPVALAGMDYVYAEKMFQAGLADVADAFNLHPGRGNYTPDWAPKPETWATGNTGSYWNYMGAMNEARRMIDEYSDGSMEFWLTEAYTPTKPNSQWEDTYRHSAENTLLTLALAKSVNVTRALWFQFYDNVKANPKGASSTNREYHFGLMLRDLSPKPSLLAFASAAEQFDEAEFVRWFAFPQPELRGLLFDTPRGPLSLIWSRADGYVLNTESQKQSDGFWPSPEPWVDTWSTKTTIELPATGATVTRIDAIGRQTKLPVYGGTVSIVVDGAPYLYYGLDVDGQDAAVPVASGPVTVKPQRVNDDAAVAVHVRNDGMSAADIVITTAFGAHRQENVAPGKAAYRLFPTGHDSIQAGAVQVSITPRNGKGAENHEIAYKAFSVVPFA